MLMIVEHARVDVAPKAGSPAPAKSAARFPQIKPHLRHLFLRLRKRGDVLFPTGSGRTSAPLMAVNGAAQAPVPGYQNAQQHQPGDKSGSFHHAGMPEQHQRGVRVGVGKKAPTARRTSVARAAQPARIPRRTGGGIGSAKPLQPAAGLDWALKPICAARNDPGAGRQHVPFRVKAIVRVRFTATPTRRGGEVIHREEITPERGARQRPAAYDGDVNTTMPSGEMPMAASGSERDFSPGSGPSIHFPPVQSSIAPRYFSQRVPRVATIARMRSPTTRTR